MADIAVHLNVNKCFFVMTFFRQFLMPGLVDTHIHAPQYIFTGTGYDVPLLQWLGKYTFPSEARFANKEFAQNAYRKVVVSSIHLFLFSIYQSFWKIFQNDQ